MSESDHNLRPKGTKFRTNMDSKSLICTSFTYYSIMEMLFLQPRSSASLQRKERHLGATGWFDNLQHRLVQHFRLGNQRELGFYHHPRWTERTAVFGQCNCKCVIKIITNVILNISTYCCSRTRTTYRTAFSCTKTSMCLGKYSAGKSRSNWPDRCRKTNTCPSAFPVRTRAAKCWARTWSLLTSMDTEGLPSTTTSPLCLP